LFYGFHDFTLNGISAYFVGNHCTGRQGEKQPGFKSPGLIFVTPLLEYG
jgi:hypothetical protein